MLKRRLIWQLYPSFILVTLLSLAAVTSYCSYAFRDFYHEQMRGELRLLAHFAAQQFTPLLDVPDSDAVDALCEEFASIEGEQVRVTVILPSGRVVGESHKNLADMENHADRPEIIEALEVGFGSSLRFSNRLGKYMMYVAMPIEEAGEPIAVVRTAVPVTAIDRALGDIYVKIFWSGVGIALLAALLSFLISRRISRPVVRMKNVARQFAQGQLDLRVPLTGPSELATLGGSLNEMARQLHSRITAITDQRNEFEAVLSSMVEGVLAVDRDGHIMSVNKAAAELLDIDPAKAKGRTVGEVVRNVEIQTFVEAALKGDEPTEAEVSLPVAGGRFFQLHGASLANTLGAENGAVIVLNDMTRTRRLENIRQDFVANVSHELKTPVTSIQGFVEALLEGGIEDPGQLRRYLDIIAKHSNRLNAIIEDLLILSRLEADQEHRRLSFTETELEPVLAAAIDLLKTKAEQKNIHVDLRCEDDIAVTMNSPLVEQAVFNLIDNGIKYSEPNKAIHVSARRDKDEVVITVQDEGWGIREEYMPRLFERFYVVDRGRSRKLGGTGLGLAIVKHIAQVHGGKVTVESEPGKGSTFQIHLPLM